MRPYLLLSLLLSLSCFAQEHSLSFGVDYHHQQSSSNGVHLSYQWQFSESFALESRFVDHRTIMIQTNAHQHFIKLKRAMVGVNFIREINNQLNIKAGTGLGYLVHSDKPSLVNKGSVSSYLNVATQFRFTNQLAVEFGQTSYFDNSTLNANHNLYAQVTWLFSHSKSAIIKPSSTKRAIKQPLEAPPNPLPINASSQWQIQLGAFSQKSYAEVLLAKIKTTVGQNNHWNIIYQNKLHRVVSQQFLEKANAEQFLNMLKSQYSLSGFLRQVK
ncbi:SPOR domain-containing protein [Thalassotalea sp. 1_MG-2023]|uniref:SPOR domain-containing protein n=1 Tax=Thalassotalea sp. 1_MG-2023 TaxID=3062680 RepID=UPI0026E446E9|nr:SPOR domain-containing protein [Thalassotalea sp. 1_MG-2023]MDO6427633.1 SPOR domain-containing protein [Thalassotalea sp. 1_MG-2023]